MDIFVEYLDGDYAVCRLPDKAKNLIRLPLRDLPEGVRELSVISMRDNGSFVINDYAREVRMKKITTYLEYKKYCFDL
ncbi:MAG: hypothetical protein IJ025_08560 [Clostridia bacterium]|nr:hypothetical protein [Clostridia bacterium]